MSKTKKCNIPSPHPPREGERVGTDSKNTVPHTVHTQCLTEHTQYLAVHTQCLTVHTQCLILHTQCLTVHTQCLTVHTQYLTVHTQYLTVHTQCLTVHTQCLLHSTHKFPQRQHVHLNSRSAHSAPPRSYTIRLLRRIHSTSQLVFKFLMNSFCFSKFSLKIPVFPLYFL